MVIKHLSSSAGLEYNEEKLFLGEAEIVDVENIPDATMFSVRAAFKTLEDNPAIHAGVRNMRIHLAVNPGPYDHADLAKVRRYIKKLMEELGYGGQPYVVFVHHDIDRIHYHVVGCRVLADGTIISDSFIGLRIKDFQERVAKEFGFTVGRPDNKDLVLKPAPIKQGMQNLVPQVRANVREAVNFRHDGLMQLNVILGTFGVRMKQGKVKSRDGKYHPYTSFRAIDGHGKPLMRPIQAKDLLGEKFDTFYSKHHEERKLPMPISVHRVRDSYFGSSDLDEFRMRLKVLGVRIVPIYGGKEKTRAAADITNALFIDFKEKDCLTLDDCKLTLDMIIRLAEKSEEKKRNKKDKLVAKASKPDLSRDHAPAKETHGRSIK